MRFSCISTSLKKSPLVLCHKAERVAPHEGISLQQSVRKAACVGNNKAGHFFFNCKMVLASIICGKYIYTVKIFFYDLSQHFFFFVKST